jgi:hypothetical protein
MQKTLLFGPGLLFPTLEGSKRVTIRRFRPEAHVFVEGEEFVGIFADGKDVLLVATADTVVRTFAEITDSEAREDGYDDATAMFEGMKQYYPDLQLTDSVGIIRYRTVPNDHGLPRYVEA